MKKPCLSCKKVGPWTRQGRCDTCRKAKVNAYEAQPERKAYKAYRYDSFYKAIRKQWVPIVETGKVNCCRCNELITDKWDLDHFNFALHPAHPACNRGKR